jgi:hypothetical protein
VWVAVSALVAMVFAGPLAGRIAPGSGHGIAAGVLYAAGDVATKAAVAGEGRLLFLAVVGACHAAAFVQMQLAFQRGRALSTAGVATLLTNALPIAASFVLFREPIPSGALGAVRIVAFIAVLVGGTLLARPSRLRSNPSTSHLLRGAAPAVTFAAPVANRPPGDTIHRPSTSLPRVTDMP